MKEPTIYMNKKSKTLNSKLLTTIGLEHNIMNEETVTISKKEYESLKEDARWLQCLENAGVDNWQGIDYAYELKREAGGEDD